MKSNERALFDISRKNERLHQMKRHLPFYILAIWPIAQFALFHYAPMYGIIIAFKDFKAGRGIMGSDWVGLKNFVTIFTDDYFYTVLINTIRISFVTLLISFPATIIFALLINELPNLRFKKIIQTISFMPYFLSWVVVGVFVYQILSPTYGTVNFLLVFLGLTKEPIFFIANPQAFLPIFVSANLWKDMGYGVIIYLAVITSINPELYESARIEGANRFQNVWHITLPSITPAISTLLILSMSGLISVGFDPIFNLYNDSTRPVADVISTYVYRKGIVNADFAYSTAVGFFQNVVSLLLILFSNFIARKVNPDYRII